MAIVINGSGTITGVSAGGLPDGCVDNDTIATGVSASKLTGTLPALDGSSLTGIATSGRLVDVHTHASLNGGISVTTNYVNTWGGGNQIAWVTVTPQTDSTTFLINFICGYTRGSVKHGIRFKFLTNDNGTTPTGHYNSYLNQNYHDHRNEILGTGYGTYSASFLYEYSGTTAVKLGIYCDIYDENTGATCNVASSASYPPKLEVYEFAMGS